MKFIIKHDIRGRLRIHMVQSRMSYEEADTLLYYIENLSGVTSAKVFERTCDASISYKGDRETLLQALRIFQYQTTDVPADLLAHSGRELNSTYQEKLVQKVVLRAGSKLFLPYPNQAAYAAFKYVHYIRSFIVFLLMSSPAYSSIDLSASATAGSLWDRIEGLSHWLYPHSSKKRESVTDSGGTEGL